MQRKEEDLTREIARSDAQIHALHCLNTLLQRPDSLAVFKRLDTSGDGQLSAEELRLGLREMGENINALEMEELMAFVDEDGNGTVAYAGFAKLVSSSSASRSSA